MIKIPGLGFALLTYFSQVRQLLVEHHMCHSQQKGKSIRLDIVRLVNKNATSFMQHFSFKGGFNSHLNGLLNFVYVPGCVLIDDE